MKTLKVQALKPHRYGTRHLTAGEEYEAPIRDAVAMVAARKARFADKPAKRAIAASRSQEPEPAPPPVEPQEDITTRLASLRAQAAQLGIAVDGRWGISRLQHEIAQVEER